MEFEMVKAAVPMKDAAELYGLSMTRDGRCCCPFHDDRHPSMKLYEKDFHCFACGAHGDVIELVARLFGLSNGEAAKKLCSDFGLSVERTDRKTEQKIRQRQKILSEKKQQKELEERCYRAYSDWYHLLRHWADIYANPETVSEFYADVLKRIPYAEYLLDCFLASEEGRKEFVQVVLPDLPMYEAIVAAAEKEEKHGRRVLCACSRNFRDSRAERRQRQIVSVA